MLIEDSVIEKIKELLPICNTVDNRYNLDWSNCSINKDNDDVNSIPITNFPYVDIEFIEEVPEDQGKNKQWLTNVLTMQVDCIPVKKNTTRKDVDMIIADVKRFFGQNNSVDGIVSHAWYNGYKRFTAQTMGKYYGVRMSFKVRYYQDKINP